MIVRFYSSNNMIFHCNCHFTFWFTTATQSCRAASRCAPLSLAGVGRHWQLSAVCWGFTREHRAAHPPITAPLPFHIPAPVPLLQPSSPTADKLNAALLHTGSWHRHRADLIQTTVLRLNAAKKKSPRAYLQASAENDAQNATNVQHAVPFLPMCIKPGKEGITKTVFLWNQSALPHPAEA